jgi:hypothetical protein
LHHKGLGVDEAEREQLAGELQNGRAAVGVLVAENRVSDVSERLSALGGDVHVLSPTDEAVAEVDAAAPQVEAAEAATPPPA